MPPLAGGEEGCDGENVTTSHIILNGGICPSNHVDCAAFDQGLFSVSLKTVQLTDTSDSAMYIQMNGPRHIPSEANTPSSNCHCLASIIPRMKFDLGPQWVSNVNLYLLCVADIYSKQDCNV
jgi:hypothetical protein